MPRSQCRVSRRDEASESSDEIVDQKLIGSTRKRGEDGVTSMIERAQGDEIIQPYGSMLNDPEHPSLRCKGLATFKSFLSCFQVWTLMFFFPTQIAQTHWGCQAGDPLTLSFNS